MYVFCTSSSFLAVFFRRGNTTLCATQGVCIQVTDPHHPFTVSGKPWIFADGGNLTFPSAKKLIVLASTDDFEVKGLVEEAHFVRCKGKLERNFLLGRNDPSKTRWTVCRRKQKRNQRKQQTNVYLAFKMSRGIVMKQEGKKEN